MSDDELSVEVATDADIELACEKLLRDAGCTLDELRAQAKVDRFTSEKARLAWFVIDPFLLAAQGGEQ